MKKKSNIKQNKHQTLEKMETVILQQWTLQVLFSQKDFVLNVRTPCKAWGKDMGDLCQLSQGG